MLSLILDALTFGIREKRFAEYFRAVLHAALSREEGVPYRRGRPGSICSRHPIRRGAAMEAANLTSCRGVGFVKQASTSQEALKRQLRDPPHLIDHCFLGLWPTSPSTSPRDTHIRDTHSLKHPCGPQVESTIIADLMCSFAGCQERQERLEPVFAEVTLVSRSFLLAYSSAHRC